MFAYVVGFFYALAQMIVGGWLFVALVKALGSSAEVKSRERRAWRRSQRSSSG
jgi:hypothetical protein